MQPEPFPNPEGSCNEPELEAAFTNLLDLIEYFPDGAYNEMMEYFMQTLGIDMTTQNGIHQFTCYLAGIHFHRKIIRIKN